MHKIKNYSYSLTTWGMYYNYKYIIVTRPVNVQSCVAVLSIGSFVPELATQKSLNQEKMFVQTCPWTAHLQLVPVRNRISEEHRSKLLSRMQLMKCSVCQNIQFVAMKCSRTNKKQRLEFHWRQ